MYFEPQNTNYYKGTKINSEILVSDECSPSNQDSQCYFHYQFTSDDTSQRDSEQS